MKTLFLLLFTILSQSSMSADLSIKEILRGVTFTDEVFVHKASNNTHEDKPWEWGLASSYNFYALKTIEQQNTLRSDILSDLSPGFDVFYQYEVLEKLSLGAKFSYQRSIFKEPDLNTLNNKSQNTFSIGLYGNYDFSSKIKLALESGYENSLYLLSVSNGVGSLSLRKNIYAKILGQITLIDYSPFKFGLETGLEKKMSMKSSKVKVSSQYDFSAGLFLKKENFQNSLNLGVYYQKGSYKVSGFGQSLHSLIIKLGISFGGRR